MFNESLVKMSKRAITLFKMIDQIAIT
jgi:hypothetical protein